MQSMQQTKLYDIDRLAAIMNNITRYSTTPSLIKESVSDHSYLIALMVIDFSYQYKDLFSHVSREQLLMRAILHDLCESVTGDIPSPAKRAVPSCERMFDEIETKISSAISEGRPDDFAYMLKKSINFSDNTDVEQTLFKSLDLLCVLIKTYNELNLGNKYYTRVANEMHEVLTKLHNDIIDKAHNAGGAFKELAKFYTLEVMSYLAKVVDLANKMEEKDGYNR